MALAMPTAADDDYLDALEQYLRAAPIVHVHSPVTQGGWQNKSMLVLAGGVMVIQKPGEGHNAPEADGTLAVRREAAAWLVSRALSWTGLVAATVACEMYCPRVGTVGPACVQVVWPAPTLPGVPVNLFDDLDTWRAAILDTLLLNTDRNADNWLGVDENPGAPHRLRLFDHGHCFTTAGNVSSPFVTLRQGGPIPDELMPNLADARNRLDDLGLSALIGTERRDDVLSRLERMIASRTVAVP